MQLVLKRSDAAVDELRRTTAAMRREHKADRRLMFSILKDHGVRLRVIEGRGAPLRGGGAELAG
jgi:hypothetical protein